MKEYDRDNKEALGQLLGIYDVADKLLIDIKGMYVDSLACVRVKWAKSECFRIDSCVTQGCVMSY